MGAGQSQEKAKKSKGKLGKKDGKVPRDPEENFTLDDSTAAGALHDDSDAESSIVWGDVARVLGSTAEGMTPLPEFPLADAAVGSQQALDPLCQDIYVTQATGQSMQAAPDLSALPPRSKLQDPFLLWRKADARQPYDARDPFSEWRPAPPPPELPALGAPPGAGPLTRGRSLAPTAPLRSVAAGGSIAAGGSVAGVAGPSGGASQKTLGAAKDKPREQLLSGPPQRREEDWAGVQFGPGEDVDMQGVPMAEERQKSGGGSFTAAFGGRQTSQASAAPPGSAHAAASHSAGASLAWRKPALGSSRTLAPPRTLPPSSRGPPMTQGPPPPPMQEASSSSFPRQGYPTTTGRGGPPSVAHHSTVPTQDDLGRTLRHGGHSHQSYPVTPSSSLLPPGPANPYHSYMPSGMGGQQLAGPPSGTVRRPSPPPSGTIRPPGAAMGGTVRVH